MGRDGPSHVTYGLYTSQLIFYFNFFHDKGNKGNDGKLKRLLIVRQILLINTIKKYLKQYGELAY